MTYEGECAGLVHLALTCFADDGDSPVSVTEITAFLISAGERIRGQRVTRADVLCGLLQLRTRGDVVAVHDGPRGYANRRECAQSHRGRDVATKYALAPRPLREEDCNGCPP